MIILGIDPGTTTVGFAFIEKEKNSVRIVEYGVIETPPRSPLADRLLSIFSDISELLDIYQPTLVAVEKLFFVRNVTNGIDVAQARGVMMYAFASRGMIIKEYTPLQVKQGITGKGNAKKIQVQRAVAFLF